MQKHKEDELVAPSKAKHPVVAGLAAYTKERTIAKLILEAQKHVDVVLVCDDSRIGC